MSSTLCEESHIPALGLAHGENELCVGQRSLYLRIVRAERIVHRRAVGALVEVRLEVHDVLLALETTLDRIEPEVQVRLDQVAHEQIKLVVAGALADELREMS